jgi:hypothetical protein
MKLISKQEWAEFCKTLLPILDRLEKGLREWSPVYADNVQNLTKKATEDPQAFVHDVFDGFLWGGMGSVIDQADRPETTQPLIDLAEALRSMGLDTDRTRAVADLLRQGPNPKKRRPQ